MAKVNFLIKFVGGVYNGVSHSFRWNNPIFRDYDTPGLAGLAFIGPGMTQRPALCCTALFKKVY